MEHVDLHEVPKHRLPLPSESQRNTQIVRSHGVIVRLARNKRSIYIFICMNRSLLLVLIVKIYDIVRALGADRYSMVYYSQEITKGDLIRNTCAFMHLHTPIYTIIMTH